MSAVRPDIDVHPKDYLPSTLSRNEWDVIVIGAGPGGEECAARISTRSKSSKAPLSVLLVEVELVGGECPYFACVPSKALLRPSETFEAGKAVGGMREKLDLLADKYGVKSRDGGRMVEVDVEGVWNRRDKFSFYWKDGWAVERMHAVGVEVVHGFGSILGEKKVGVKDWHSGEMTELTAKVAVVISTGSAPVIPPIEGLEGSGFWTPREAVTAREIPEHLVVLGGGAVGTELACAYRQMGARVTLLVHRILPKFVKEASGQVKKGLEVLGVDVKEGTDVQKVERKDGVMTIILKDGGVVKGSELLIATGRNARTQNMNLEKVGGPKGGAWVDVDHSMCATSVSKGWLYVIGDPNGIAAMTHMSKYHGRIAADAILAKAKGNYKDGLAKSPFSTLTDQASRLAIPQGVFTDPQVASVGLTPDQAKANGLKIDVISTKMAGPGTSLHAEEYQGWAQWVAEKESGKLVGATMVGRDVVDLIQGCTVAIVGGMTLEQLWHAVPPFPTMSEVYTSLSEAAEGLNIGEPDLG
jgi:pyruvate/2-oxoglutarate dehydrogenase complex dihydrolipoamide dehydrogenase (E3) component